MFDWKISIGAVLVMLLSAWLGHRFSVSRDERNSFKTKAREFQELLTPFLRALEAPDAHPAALITQNFRHHDEAARKLRLYMSDRKRRLFDDRWKAYEELYREKEAQGVLGLIATEVDELSKASPGRPGVQEYMLEQTAKRRNQTIKVIRDALDVL